MKTLLPIVISLGLLVPFSPVGEYLWHSTQQQSHTLLVASQQQALSWHGELNRQVTDMSNSWRQGAQSLQMDLTRNQHYIHQQGQAMAQSWQQWFESWRAELDQQWQTICQWPHQLWQETISSGESQWASLLRQQEQLQHRMSNSLNQLEARMTAQTE